MENLLGKAYLVYDMAVNLLPPLIALLAVVANMTKSSGDDKVVSALRWLLGLVMKVQLPGKAGKQAALEAAHTAAAPKKG